MLTENRAYYRTQDWFLIACDGDLVLKLAQGLMIGEDERGQTVLSPAREDALLRISSDHGCLTLQALAMDWTFSENGGLSVQHLTFVEGVTLRLTFPKSTLLITPDFQAGMQAQVDREIFLTPTRTPALTLTRVGEPVVLMEPLPAPEALADDTGTLPRRNVQIEEELLEEAAAQARAAEALTRWAHEIPDEQLEEHTAPPPLPFIRPETPKAESGAAQALRKREASRSGSAEEASLQTGSQEGDAELSPARATPGSATVTALPGPEPAQRNHLSLASLIAAAALLAPMCLFLADPRGLGVDFPLSNYRSPDEQVQTPVALEPVPVTGAEPMAGSPQTPDLQPLAIEIPQTAPVDPSPRNEADALLIASLLAEARAYYDAGSIVTPAHANAVNNLTQVLNMDPSNEEGLKLMYMSAVALIEEAEAAHAAGNEFLARNLVEEVLGFHPEFDDARALLDSWTRVPEG